METLSTMKFTRRTALAALIGFLTLSTVQAEDSALKSLSGKWSSDKDGITAEWTFEANKLTATVNGNQYKAEVSVDAAAKPHNTMDLKITESPEGNTDTVGKAIYKIDGEKLIICVSMPGQNRPEEFSTIDEVQYKFELKKN